MWVLRKYQGGGSSLQDLALWLLRSGLLWFLSRYRSKTQYRASLDYDNYCLKIIKTVKLSYWAIGIMRFAIVQKMRLIRSSFLRNHHNIIPTKFKFKMGISLKRSNSRRRSLRRTESKERQARNRDARQNAANMRGNGVSNEERGTLSDIGSALRAVGDSLNNSRSSGLDRAHEN
ncbi:Hypothetical predicted protein [Paramuricea clavata]|uniref:Uncharacterized protein n=1 Tax=Paramuricea clavata TaxID=317549 RepID=A0A6S7HRD7_PARCT|nr:Hypothetical predicted protein [Paramuricea clavata]